MSLSFLDLGKRHFICLKIASEICLGAFHSSFDEDFLKRCLEACLKVLSNDLSYKNDLEALCKELLEDKKGLPFTKDISVLFNEIPPIVFVANAKELAFYERSHLNENTSYAIGQLVNAEWKIKEHSKEIRELRHKVEQNKASEEDFDIILKKIWAQNENK